MDSGKQIEAREESRGDTTSSAKGQDLHNLREVQKAIEANENIALEQQGENGNQEDELKKCEGGKERRSIAEGEASNQLEIQGKKQYGL